MIFGNWRPVGMFFGSLLFGYTQALPLREGTVTLHGLLLLVAVLLFALTIYQLLRGSRAASVASFAFAGAFLAWYLLSEIVPREFTTMAPYIMTLLVLSFASQRLRMPAADGQIYRKGSAG
jgi:simple sugar transport system permease protein